jgi:diguanylate cyclase (GGDEF)-like protein/PAS domain S-box-containing protein
MIAAHPRWGWPQLLAANFAIVAVYLAEQWLSTGLDLPPGYATPLFPPAGVGFALAVLAGWRVLPGVALGALLLHLPAVWLPGVAVRDAWLATAAVIFGSVVQAWLGARWFRRWIHPALDLPRDVTRFLMLAPFMCLVSATVTVPALYKLGVVSEAERVGSWLSWWAGDVVGVLLAAPLCWIVTAPPRALWRRRARLVAIPLLLAAAAVVATYEQAVHWETDQNLNAFRVRAQQAADLVQAEFSEHSRFVDTVSRALGDRERIMPEEKFQRIARGYVEGRSEVQGIDWAVRVSDEERPVFERWARANLDPGFTISDADPTGHMHPAPPRARYYVVLYTTPPNNNPVRGLDFLGDPVRASVIYRMMRYGSATATPPLRLAVTKRIGIVLARGVGDEGSEGSEPPALVVMVLDAENMVRHAFKHSGLSDFQFQFIDVTAGGAGVAVAGTTWKVPRRGEYRLALTFVDRRYQLVFAPGATYFSQRYGWASWTVLTAGLLLTGMLGALMLLTSGERARIQAQVADRTSRLRDREARLQAILDNAADAIVTLDAEGRLVSANPATARLFGYQLAHLAGLPLSVLVPPKPDENLQQMLARLAHAAPDQRELHGENARGERFPLSISVARVLLPTEHMYVCILHDLTEQHRSQADIYRLAHHDELTGLENRYALSERLKQQLAHAQRSGETVAVLFIDLDRFKKINDSHGHAAGDQLLLGAAHRMKDLLRGDIDVLGRLGGDEFVIVLGGPLTPDSVSAVAVRVVHSLAQPYHLNGVTVHSGASVGVALYPDDGDDAPTLLRNADTAMYAAKREGRGNFQFFSEAMNAATHEHLLLEARMRATLEHNGFELHLQAQVELDTGRVIGAEVLLRWHDKELGSVEPSRFIPVAEECGLILPLGDWVLTRAMALLAEWQLDGMGDLRLAVNLSARQFSGSGLLARLDQLLVQHRIDPACLELEITETAAMRDPESTRHLLRQLRNRGFKLAIDDFGTGYSSLAYLKLFAIDRIKIDRAFVKDIETDPNDASIVAATIGLAHSLGLTVVAEGVETNAQWGFLRDKHGDEAQGFLFARPMPVAQFRDFVRERALPVLGP